MKKLLLLLVFVPALLFSQTRKQRKAMAARQKADKQIIIDLKNHSLNLAKTNTTSEVRDSSEVREYITNQFKIIGLQQKGSNGYIQPSKIDAGKHIKTTTFLKVNGSTLIVKREYFPLPYSAEKSITGMPAMALREKGVPWFVDVKDLLDDTLQNQAADVDKKLQKEVERAAAKGATALFLYNSTGTADNIRFNNKDHTSPLAIPVIYITPEGFKKYFSDQSQVLDIELNVGFEKVIRNYNNIVGYMDNGAQSNIMIAAPYNPLYKDEYEAAQDSLRKDAVDAVSGTSVLLELAKMLGGSKVKNNNYVFVAYSGESLISQSNKWIKNSSQASAPGYIIDLNNVGRYDDGKRLIIESYGIGVDGLEKIKPMADQTLEIVIDSSLKAKDTSVRSSTPVLSFFTDVRAPTLSPKVNYEGEMHIARFIYQLVEATNTKGKLDFAQNN